MKRALVLIALVLAGCGPREPHWKRVCTEVVHDAPTFVMMPQYGPATRTTRVMPTWLPQSHCATMKLRCVPGRDADGNDIQCKESTQ